MRGIAKLFVGALVVFVISMSGVAAAQCVNCGIRSGCQACVGSGIGGNGCWTPDCSTCTVEGICTGGGSGYGGFCGPGASPQPTSSERPGSVFRLSTEVIEEVGRVHPRFAATLANQNNFGFHVGVYKVHWTPVPLNSSDVSAFVHRSENAEFFAALNKKAAQLNQRIAKGSVQEIVYEVYVEAVGSDSISLRLEVANGSDIDPSYKRLSMKIASGPVGASGSAVVQPTEWSVEPR